MDDQNSNDGDCNEELYREILMSSQNRYSHPADYNNNNMVGGEGQLDTS